jgi:hypothetical protein
MSSLNVVNDGEDGSSDFIPAENYYCQILQLIHLQKQDPSVAVGLSN